MNGLESLLEVPAGETLARPSMYGYLLVLVGLFALAIVWELVRRARARALHRAAQWESIEQIASEKELTDNEFDLLREVLQRHHPDDPLRAVTTRLHFDRCVRAEMEFLAQQGDSEKLAQIGAILRDIRRALALDFVSFGQRIESTRELYPNQILLLAPKGDVSPHWIKGRVQMVDEAFFWVSPMVGADSPPAWRAGEELRCRLWREEDARYAFSVVLAATEHAPEMWRIQHAEKLSRMQQRAHYRTRFEQATVFDILTAPPDGDLSVLKDREPVTRVRGKITNLSAGGFAAILPQELPKQAIMRAELELDGERPILVHANVIANSVVSGGRVLIRVSFVGMDTATQDIIAKFVLHKEHPIADDLED